MNVTVRRTELHDALDKDYDSIQSIVQTAKTGKQVAKDIAGALEIDLETVESVLALIPTSALNRMRNLHHTIINIELNTPSEPDGFPTSVIGASDPTGTAPYVPEEERGVDYTTERAVIARTQHRTDEYRRKVRDANGYLADAARALRAANNCLRWCIDKPVDTISDTENRQVCWAMARLGVEKWNEPVARRIVDPQGKAIPLGSWAYNFRVRNRRLPTVQECELHASGRRVMISA